jgi:hypothetical protein
MTYFSFVIERNVLQEKAAEATKQKEEKRKNLSPRNTKACHSISTTLLQSVAEIGTQSVMKSNRKTLHELSPHIPPITPIRNISSLTNEMLHTDINVGTQRTRFSNTLVMEVKNCHQNS